MATSSVETKIHVEDIHYRLLSDLITGYFGNGGKTVDNNIRWKMHFRKYCRLPSQQDCDVLQNIIYLEQSGLIGIGKYSVLRHIFRYVDQRALLEIDEASKLINDIKEMSYNVTTGRVGIVKIKIKPQKNLIEEKLTYIFHEFVTCFDEMVFLQRPWPDRYFNYCSHMSPIQIGINISTGALPREMYPELSKLIQDTREKLRHFISPDNKDAVKSARIIVEKLLNFLNDIKTKYNAKRLEITWEEAMVISVEFDNEYDLRTFLRCSYFLRRDTRDTFALIFRHVNEIRLATPYVEIQHAVLDNIPWN